MRMDKAAKLRKELRQAVADYMYSEGCSCCQGDDHIKHAARLAELLNVPPYRDEPEYFQFEKYRSKAND
jgi:hypothetical protein